MTCSPLQRILLSGAVLLASAFLATPASAQEKKDKSEKVNITTADGVTLIGNFYPASSPKKPAVIILHNIGDHSRMKPYQALAEDLQKKDFAVLTFDFRGHGQSTDIDAQTFWPMGSNAQQVKGAPKKATIDYKDFSPAYWPVLANDLAAVKAFLDRKNDGGACNTASTVLIGVEQGATIGALWLNSEWYRFKMVPNPLIPMGLPVPHKNPEGKEVVAAVWLGISPKLGSRSVTPYRVLDVPGKGGATPMLFMFGDADTTGKKIAKDCARNLIIAKEKERYKYTGDFEIKGSVKNSGVGLLAKGVGGDEPTSKLVAEWLDSVILAKGNEWYEREWKKTNFKWRLPSSNPLNPSFIPARLNAQELNLLWDNYNKFLP